jgi:hypothetical protein
MIYGAELRSGGAVLRATDGTSGTSLETMLQVAVETSHKQACVEIASPLSKLVSLQLRGWKGQQSLTRLEEGAGGQESYSSRCFKAGSIERPL